MSTFPSPAHQRSIARMRSRFLCRAPSLALVTCWRRRQAARRRRGVMSGECRRPIRASVDGEAVCARAHATCLRLPDRGGPPGRAHLVALDGRPAAESSGVFLHRPAGDERWGNMCLRGGRKFWPSALPAARARLFHAPPAGFVFPVCYYITAPRIRLFCSPCSPVRRVPWWCRGRSWVVQFAQAVHVVRRCPVLADVRHPMSTCSVVDVAFIMNRLGKPKNHSGSQIIAASRKKTIRGRVGVVPHIQHDDLKTAPPSWTWRDSLQSTMS